MEIKDKIFIFIKNRGTIITCMFPVTPIGPMGNCYLLNVTEYIFNAWFIVGCFLLGIIVINVLLMTDNSRSNDIPLTHNVANEPDRPKCELTGKLLAQLLHNNAHSIQPLTYLNFPSDHPGYLNLEARIRFVSIIRSSSLANEYRFGSSLGNIYIKNTYRHPIITTDMVAVVLSRESLPN